MANPGQRMDAFPAFHFEVDIAGTSYPFRSCTGLSSETKVVEVEEGGVNSHIHKLVGPTTFPNLVLRQGFCNPSSPLYQMYQRFLNGSGQRFDGYVRQLGPNGTSAKWVFQKGWIAKWQGPELEATKNEVSIESIEIVHEGLQLVGGSGGALNTLAGGSYVAGLPAASTTTPAKVTVTVSSPVTGGATVTTLPTGGSNRNKPLP